jgi:hypothetical protein
MRIQDVGARFRLIWVAESVNEWRCLEMQDTTPKKKRLSRKGTMRQAAQLARMLTAITAFTALSTIASAAPIPYETIGVFDRTGRDTDWYVGFEPAQARGPVTFEMPGSLYLGQFMVEPLLNSGLPPGPTNPEKSFSYQADPFTVTVTLRDLSRGSGGPADGVDVLELKGVLNGTLTGTDKSTLTATVTSVAEVSGDAPLPFDLSSLHVQSPLALVASSGLSPGAINFGLTPLTATVTVPEPSPSALWGVVATLVLATSGRGRRTPRC